MLICVDLDGTLLDTIPANAASYRAALEEQGFTVTDEYYAKYCNGGYYKQFLRPLMGGDAFASGLIYAMMHDYKPMDMINFAVASSAIKHTIHGDANITDDVESIRNLMNMNYDIKR